MCFRSFIRSKHRNSRTSFFILTVTVYWLLVSFTTAFSFAKNSFGVFFTSKPLLCKGCCLFCCCWCFCCFLWFDWHRWYRANEEFNLSCNESHFCSGKIILRSDRSCILWHTFLKCRFFPQFLNFYNLFRLLENNDRH